MKKAIKVSLALCTIVFVGGLSARINLIPVNASQVHPVKGTEEGRYVYTPSGKPGGPRRIGANTMHPANPKRIVRHFHLRWNSETAVLKVRLAEDGWNSRDPEKVALATR